MEQRLNISDAVVKDAQILLSREEYVLGMGQRLQRNNAVLKDAPI